MKTNLGRPTAAHIPTDLPPKKKTGGGAVTVVVAAYYRDGLCHEVRKEFHEAFLSFTVFFSHFLSSGGWRKISLSSLHFHVFSYMSCVNLTQLDSQSSWLAGVSFSSRGSDSASHRFPETRKLSIMNRPYLAPLPSEQNDKRWVGVGRAIHKAAYIIDLLRSGIQV